MMGLQTGIAMPMGQIKVLVHARQTLYELSHLSHIKEKLLKFLNEDLYLRVCISQKYFFQTTPPPYDQEKRQL